MKKINPIQLFPEVDLKIDMRSKEVGSKEVEKKRDRNLNTDDIAGARPVKPLNLHSKNYYEDYV